MSEIQNKAGLSMCSTRHTIWVKREHNRRKKWQGTKNDIYVGIQDTHFRRKTVINIWLL